MMTIDEVQKGYRDGTISPADLVSTILKRSEEYSDHNIWIHQLSKDQIDYYLDSLPAEPNDDFPLWGIPFAIKDNIDLASVPTTAGCPDYAYTPDHHAYAVELLIKAGAIPIGKTNLDQFATGLVGTRSPYGICRNVFNKDYISGGSSSGSAVATAAGLVCFALGTDTAGSGRVPAAFNGIYGYKPTKGVVSCSGVVPACRSLDCVSVFANSPEDCSRIGEVLRQYDESDIYSRPEASLVISENELVLGVPKSEQLEFFGNEESSVMYRESIVRLKQMGYQVREIDFSAFIEAAKLLYEGPWVVERRMVASELLKSNPSALDETVRKILESKQNSDAAEVFAAMYDLKRLTKLADRVWDEVDIIVIPTTGTVYTIDEVVADPIQTNSNLGYYTNYMNLLDLCGISIPAGRFKNGVGFGITLVGEAFEDHRILELAQSWEEFESIEVAVCGAHMDGLSLNHQLIGLGAVFVKRTQSSANYKLYNLDHLDPIRPGMVRCEAGGYKIEVEVWRMPLENLGKFMTKIAYPLGIGSVELEDGSWVKGFACESSAVSSDSEISEFGGWRNFLKSIRLN
ncbi:MAG: allophanate hydrolase [Opitutales bacterium]|nr:allophanate hydrolase [Opitutales bacterium]